MLKDRINILQMGGVISTEVAEYTKQIIDMLDCSKYQVEKMEMFTTHLAMATERASNGEDVGDLDDSIWNQILADENYGEAITLMDRLDEISPVKYSNNEKKFLIMHLCNLMQDKEE